MKTFDDRWSGPWCHLDSSASSSPSETFSSSPQSGIIIVRSYHYHRPVFSSSIIIVRFYHRQVLPLSLIIIIGLLSSCQVLSSSGFIVRFHPWISSSLSYWLSGIMHSKVSNTSPSSGFIRYQIKHIIISILTIYQVSYVSSSSQHNNPFKPNHESLSLTLSSLSRPSKNFTSTIGPFQTKS